ncbi:type II toxin-antitoxin system PemI/MazE family antitoxin [Enterococcus casseliflavus]|uniref:type II toxin-antitoxin system PemI/MazE family antitoxin n=2 Tax=Enterococcus TaxID=1350 RepID=UPI003D0D50C2
MSQTAIMKAVKTRIIGNSLVISLPKELQIKENQYFYCHQKENGIIELVPKIENPLKQISDEK